MKQLLYIGITIIMIFFKNSSHAEYEKIFYDFKINSITGDQIDLKDFGEDAKEYADWLKNNVDLQRYCKR